MKRRLLGLLVFGLLASAVLVTGVSAATTVFATGMAVPESITQTASGNFFVPDANGQIWNVPATGGTASLAADLSATLTLRGGLILPSSFGLVGGKFLYVGASDTGEYAGVMDTSTPFATALFASNTDTSGLWTQPVFAPSFGSFSGDVLVTNQGGSVDYITPSGGIGTLATFAAGVAPFGAALAGSSFGEVGGPSLIVSDSGGNGIYTVDTHGTTKLFTTIPLGTGQNSLRQIAFAPKEWKKYGGDLFVSVNTRDIDIVNRDGVVIGKISGAFNPRGLLFTTMAGKPTLLFSNTADGSILKAGPGDVVPVAS